MGNVKEKDVEFVRQQAHLTHDLKEQMEIYLFELKRNEGIFMKQSEFIRNAIKNELIRVGQIKPDEE